MIGSVRASPLFQLGVIIEGFTLLMSIIDGVRPFTLNNLGGVTPSASWSDSAASPIRIPGLLITLPVLE